MAEPEVERSHLWAQAPDFFWVIEDESACVDVILLAFEQISVECEDNVVLVER